MKKTNNISCPPSETHLGLNMLGMLNGCLTVILLRVFMPDLGLLWSTVIVLAMVALPVALIELGHNHIFKKATTGLRENAKKANAYRVALKLVGLLGTLGIFGALYYIIPEYHKDFYNRYFAFLHFFIPILLGIAVPYFWWMDGRMKEPNDAYVHMGKLVLLRWKEVNFVVVGRHLRDWLVKAFFLPLMFTYMGDNIRFLLHYDFSRIHNFISFYDFAYNFIFFIDLTYAAVGYILTMRVLDTHIRSSEPTFRGWVVAVMCYTPFWNVLFYGLYFSYNDGYYWGHWLADYPGLKVLWGSTILVLVSIYAVATICLGLRFSNLTYRGLITNGPYRFTKHPAYVTKNLSWWMISIPFISQAGIGEAVSHCVLLFGVNVIYYLRARTEENHLSNYPEYVTYGEYMNQRGALRFMNKLLPFLVYRPRPSSDGG